MRATARIVAVAEPGGRTRLAELRGQSPLLPRRTGPRGAGPAEVHLVGGAAGPLGGDDLQVRVEVGPAAQLCVRTVAAALTLPGPAGAVSRVTVHAEVAAGGRLCWLPEPVIAAAGCDHDAASRVEVAAGGALHWRDEVVCGRHGEACGDLRQDTTVRYAGRTIYRHRLSIGPAAPGWSAAAVLGAGRATGSMVIVEPDWVAAGPPPATVLGPAAAAMPLTGPAVLVTAVAADLRGVRSVLDRGRTLAPLRAGPGPVVADAAQRHPAAIGATGR